MDYDDRENEPVYKIRRDGFDYSVYPDGDLVMREFGRTIQATILTRENIEAIVECLYKAEMLTLRQGKMAEHGKRYAWITNPPHVHYFQMGADGLYSCDCGETR